MKERTAGRAWLPGASRLLAGTAGWVALAAAVSPWSTRGQGEVLVGIAAGSGVSDLGALDVEGLRYVTGITTLHAVDASVLPLAALTLWIGAIRWRHGRRWGVLAAGLVLVVHGATGLVMPLVASQNPTLWYGPHLALAAGVAAVLGWVLARGAPPDAAPGRERDGETRLRDAVVDVDLRGYAAPRVVRVLWALLATASFGAYVVAAIVALYGLAGSQAAPTVADVLDAAAVVVVGLVAVLVAVLALRVVADLLVVPFRIAHLLADGRRPEQALAVPGPTLDDAREPEPEPEPRAEPDPEPEPEPWISGDADRPTLEGTADQWYRRPERPPPPRPQQAPSPERDEVVPEARGIPEDAPGGHPLRRPPDEDDRA